MDEWEGAAVFPGVGTAAWCMKFLDYGEALEAFLRNPFVPERLKAALQTAPPAAAAAIDLNGELPDA